MWIYPSSLWEKKKLLEAAYAFQPSVENLCDKHILRARMKMTHNTSVVVCYNFSHKLRSRKIIKANNAGARGGGALFFHHGPLEFPVTYSDVRVISMIVRPAFINWSPDESYSLAKKKRQTLHCCHERPLKRRDNGTTEIDGEIYAVSCREMHVDFVYTT